MRDNPEISIIIPVYNTENYLCRCIDSLLNQTFSNFEILLIDDGSTDLSLTICREYESRDSRIRVLSQINKGVSSARNYGIKLSKGNFITFIDSDDYVSNDYLKLIYKKTDFTTAGYYEQQQLGDFKKIDFREGHFTIDYVKMNINIFLDKGYFGAPWSKMYNARIIRENNLFFPEGMKLSEDSFFTMRFLKHANDISVVSNSKYHNVYRGDSITKSFHVELASWLSQTDEETYSFFDLSEPKNNLYMWERCVKRIHYLLSYYNRQDTNMGTFNKTQNLKALIFNEKLYMNTIEWGIHRYGFKNKVWFFLLKHNKYDLADIWESKTAILDNVTSIFRKKGKN